MHPRLLSFDRFVVYSFGLLMVIAFLAALWWVMREARRQGLPAQRVMSLSLWLIGGGLVGAKVFKAIRLLLLGEGWLLEGESQLGQGQLWLRHSESSWIALLNGAGDFYGGFLGAVVVALIYFRVYPELPAWRVADLYGPALALGQAIGRVGCLMAGDDYGKPTGLPWAVTFTNPEAASIGGAPLGVPLHPVQLYESLACLGLFVFLVWLSRRPAVDGESRAVVGERQSESRPRFDGEIILSYALGYAACRFVVEFFRGDVDRGVVLGGWLSTSQAIALVVIVASVILLRTRRRSSP